MLYHATYPSVNAHLAVLDVDGVVLNFDKAFAIVGSAALGRPLVKACNAYSLRQRYALSQMEFDRIWSALDDHEQGWSNMPVMPGAVDAIQRIQAHGYGVHLVTGIDGRHSENRLSNLERLGIRVEGIDCVGIGQNSKRDPLLRLMPAQYVEDRLHLLEEVPFVPYRVFVDLDDTQDGHVLHEDIIYARSLASWVDQLDVLHGGPAIRSERAKQEPRRATM